MLEINNTKMKRRKIDSFWFLASAVVLTLLAYWLYSTLQPLHLWAYVLLGALAVIAGFQLYFGIEAFKNEKLGLEPHDELSKRIKERAAAKAFKFSILMWLFALIFFIDLVPIESFRVVKMVVAFGMLGMVLIYLITWFYLSKAGIHNENEN